MKVMDHLTKDQQQKLKSIHKPKMSRREVEELMNKNMPTYKRVGGALRRKG